MGRMRAQAERFGTEILTRRARRVDLSRRPFGIWVADPDRPEPEYTARALIVSTGARALMLGIESEERLLGHGVSTCATCDGAFFRSVDIAVVGGGDSALEEAIFLTKFASKVTVIHRRRELRASKIMQERARKNAKIEFCLDSRVVEALGDRVLEGLRIRNVVTDEETTLPVGGLFVAIGHAPNTDLFKGQLAMDDNGYLLTEPGTSRTDVAGVFACGDVQDHTYRQAITAAGSGCMAAIDAERFLEAMGDAPDALETPTEW
jgi:thioredoxin reductase (NADPH)